MKHLVLVLVLLFGLQAQASYLEFVNSGESSVTVTGKNTDVDASANETLNSNGGTISFPASANFISLESTSTDDVGGVVATGTITVVDYTEMENGKALGTVQMKANNLMTAAKATGSIKIGGAISQLDNGVININGVALTEGVDWTLDTVNGKNTTASNLATSINSNGSVNGYLSAVATLNEVAITYATNGTAGNSIGINVDNGLLNGLTLVGTTSNDTTLSGGRAALLITVNGNGLTAGTDFAIGSNLYGTAYNLANAINTDNVLNGYLLASASGTITTITYTSNGSAGNAITLTTNNTNAASVSGATFSGGTDLLTLSVNGVDFVAGVDFTPATSNTVTAANIVTAINANGTVAEEVIATNTDNAITLTALAEGTTANSIALASDNTNGATVSGANLAGGVADGNGANLVFVEGLDSTYTEISETVVLTGNDAVLTTNQYLRLNSLEVSEAGSTGSAQGAITATQNGSSTFLGKILADTNQANLGYYTVPAGKNAYLTDLTGSILSGSGVVNVYTQATESGGVIKDRRVDTLTDNGSNFIPGGINVPVKFAPRTDIIFTGDADTDNSSVQVRAEFLLVE